MEADWRPLQAGLLPCARAGKEGSYSFLRECLCGLIWALKNKTAMCQVCTGCKGYRRQQERGCSITRTGVENWKSENCTHRLAIFQASFRNSTVKQVTRHFVLHHFFLFLRIYKNHTFTNSSLTMQCNMSKTQYDALI